MADNTAKDKAEARKVTGDRVSETPDKGTADPGPYEGATEAAKRETAASHPVTHPEYEDPILRTPPPAPGAPAVETVGYEHTKEGTVRDVDWQ